MRSHIIRPARSPFFFPNHTHRNGQHAAFCPTCAFFCPYFIDRPVLCDEQCIMSSPTFWWTISVVMAFASLTHSGMPTGPHSVPSVQAVLCHHCMIRTGREGCSLSHGHYTVHCACSPLTWCFDWIHTRSKEDAEFFFFAWLSVKRHLRCRPGSVPRARHCPGDDGSGGLGNHPIHHDDAGHRGPGPGESQGSLCCNRPHPPGQAPPKAQKTTVLPGSRSFNRQNKTWLKKRRFHRVVVLAGGSRQYLLIDACTGPFKEPWAALRGPRTSVHSLHLWTGSGVEDVCRMVVMGADTASVL